MVTAKEDSKIIKLESPSVAGRNPNTNKILDNVLESVGLKRDNGGCA